MKGLLMVAMFVFSACAPNRAILQDNRAESGVAEPTPTAIPEPARKLTVAELMDRVANAPPDAYLYPCTLNAFSPDDRANLKRLRDTWMSKEQDSRYLISPSTGCICPGACVLAVEDTQAPAPKNSSLIVIDDLSKNNYSWLARDLDMTNASLTWTGTIPAIDFSAGVGKSAAKKCLVEFDKAQKKYSTNCTDPAGKRLSPL
jgi:hypothetical protein